MEFGKRLMELRRQRGWSQEQLGERIHVTRQTVSKWEPGETTPELRKLTELADLLGMTLDELVGREPVYGYERAACQEEEDAAWGYSRTEQELEALREQYSLLARHIHYEYKSERKLFGLPLLHVNVGQGLYRAKGIVAIGNAAAGLIALGGFSAGLFSFGGLAVGLLSIGGLSLGLLLALGGVALGAVAFGGCAVGLLAFGGLAVGLYSIGGCAVAARAAAGGYASAYIAVGEETRGAICFPDGQGNGAAITQAIRTAFPGTWNWVAELIGRLG